MAKTIMIRFFVDFIAYLAKFTVGHQKQAKNITSASPLIFAINPHATSITKAMYCENAPVTEVKGLS